MAKIKEEIPSDDLTRIKRNVESAYLYFKPNYDLYNNMRKHVFDTSLDSETIALLKTLKKPQLEFNVQEAFISRLRGEFSKQEPSIEVMADDKVVDVEMINIVQGHFKHILDSANKAGFEYNTYTDTLSGGFSVGKVWTEYKDEMSFDQVIKVGRVWDPVLTGFDPLAVTPHKGDGNFCFELFPRTKVDFIREHPEIDISKLQFTKAIEGFNWSYRNEKEDILLICDYYEKKKTSVEIVQIAGNKVMKLKDYKDMLKEWEQMGIIEQPPVIIGEPRKTDIITIVRTRFIEDQILKQEDTVFKMLPLVFFDGNSMILRYANDQTSQQKCRPYVYHTRGLQKLKNFAGQTLANELENMVQHKFMVAKEAIPLDSDYEQAYRDVQQADLLVYNFTNELAPEQPLPPPAVIPRVNIPPEVTNTFTAADNMMQNILGSFDMDIAKMSQQQTSGIAIVEAATQNNSAAMPFIVGYLQGLNRMAEIVIDIMPKFIKTSRTIPIIGEDGQRTYVKVNPDRDKGEKGVDIKYDENVLSVRVEAGVNFSVQKSRALNQIIQLMQSSPLFAQFMNTVGLEVLLDNIEIRGIDQIKEMAKAWMQQLQQQQQQQAQQPNPEMMKTQMALAKVQQDSQKQQSQFMLDMEKLKQAERKIMSDVMLEKDKNQVQLVKAETERFAKQVDLQIKHADVRHKQRMDIHDRTHVKPERV
jgi:hypothetical protein